MSKNLVVMVVLALAAGCGAGKSEIADDVSAIGLEAGKADGAFERMIVGSIALGETQSVKYRNPPRYRVLKFAGERGTLVDVTVASESGDAVAWVLDDSFRVIGFNDDADETTFDARIELTLPGNTRPEIQTYYIVVREYRHRPATFTVTLTGAPTCSYDGQTWQLGDSFPSTDGCNTCFCGAGGVGCTKRACIPTELCSFGGTVYRVGDTFPAPDGCNTCTCTTSGIACTEKFCVNN